METEVLKEQHYVEELVDIIRSGLPKEELIDRLSDYHDNDIADALTKLTPDERRELYPLIGVERVAEIFAYLDDAVPEGASDRERRKDRLRDGLRRCGGCLGRDGCDDEA